MSHEGPECQAEKFELDLRSGGVTEDFFDGGPGSELMEAVF